MKYRTANLLFATAIVCSFANTVDAQAPKKFNLPPGSPQIHADRTVTFRLKAPKAAEVSVSGDFGGNKAMTKDEQGVWSVTLGPLEPNVYGYGFTVDGVRMLDPGNSVVKPGRSVTTSILDVRGDKPLPHDFTDVPHGTLHSHTYRSKSLGKPRNLMVYTPPGYEAGKQTYPVFFLLHGAGDNEGTWTALGRAHWIMDNLIAAGKTKPMVVVMPDGHAAFAQPRSPVTPFDNAMEEDLLKDILPFVEANYRVEKSPAQRAIAGLSMGGGQSLAIGLNHPEIFSRIGAFSAAIPKDGLIAPALDRPAETNKAFKQIWIACGKDDFLFKRNVEFDQLLKGKGINHQFLETEGNHSWPVWRRYLADYAPQLFQEK